MRGHYGCPPRPVPTSPLIIWVLLYLRWPVSWLSPSSSICVFSASLVSPLPLKVALLKAGSTRRVNASRGNPQPIGDESHQINTPVSQAFGAKILTFILHGVLNGPQRAKGPTSHSSHSLLSNPFAIFSLFPVSLFQLSHLCFLKSSPK